MTPPIVTKTAILTKKVTQMSLFHRKSSFETTIPHNLLCTMPMSQDEVFHAETKLHGSKQFCERQNRDEAGILCCMPMS